MLPMSLSQLHVLEDTPSPLIHLFDEIWTLILKKLTQKEALNLRRVNKDFKAKIDNLYEDWVIRIDDKCPYLNTILDLRLKKVTVKRLLKPIPNRPLGIILKFPGLLETIDVSGYPGISDEYLHILLSQCKNLKSIAILSYDPFSKDSFWKTLVPLVGYNFSELHTLKIDFGLLDDLTEGNFYEFFLTRSRMPKLKSIHVIWSETRYPATFRRLASALFLFMGRHGQTLKHFTCNHSTRIPFSELSNLDESALPNCSNLESLKIRSYSSTDCLMGIWIRLIQNQSKLVILKITADVPISKTMWAKVCANNFRTLTEFEFRGVRVESETLRYDLSVFSKCVSLKYLSLNLWHEMGDSNGEFFCNFETLPDQIETLFVNSFLISREELSEFLNSHHSLLNLVIDSVADKEGEFGVTSSALTDILEHDSLKSVKIFEDCISKPNSQTELADLKKFFSDLGCTKAWNKVTEIILKKSSESNEWLHTFECESDSDDSGSDD